MSAADRAAGTSQCVTKAGNGSLDHATLDRMTETPSSLESEVAERPDASRKSQVRRHLNRGLSCLGIIAVAIGGWLWSHPRAFDGASGDLVGADAWKAGTPLYTGLTFAQEGATGTVTIVSARPHELRPQNAAKTAFYVCTLDPSERVGGLLSASDSDIADTCSSLVPATGATLDLAAKPSQVLLMKVTPNRAGVVTTVRGADVTYRYGWQRGMQRLGTDVRLHTADNE